MTTPSDQAAIEVLKQRDYVCSICRETKVGTEFRWSLYKRDSYCKVCRRAKDRERYKNSNGAGKDRVFDQSLRRLYGITLAVQRDAGGARSPLCPLRGEAGDRPEDARGPRSRDGQDTRPPVPPLQPAVGQC